MIIILGGTTEGRKAAKELEEAGRPFFYSTKTGEQDVALHHGVAVSGGMDEAAMEQFCRDEGIRLVVDAAHPFASRLHLTAWNVVRRLAIPLIRYERIYPERDADIVWCADFDEAVRQVSSLMPAASHILATTGVQTIAALKPLEGQGFRMTYRILERDSSLRLALRQGASRSQLCFYHEGDDDRPLLSRLRPDVILLKESGLSGGFLQKVEAARSMGIRLFCICRPPLPWQPSAAPAASVLCVAIPSQQIPPVVVNGEHGLRRQIERLLPDFFSLKTGLTTGTCATAAAIAALTGQHCVSVRLPNGEDIDVEVSAVEPTQPPRASVVKHAGDDPDLTDGLTIRATVQLTDDPSRAIVIDGGQGVGRVTLPGLGLPIGSAAINEVPQRMIRQNLRPLIGTHGAIVTIDVPDGEATATRTFNPRIGVVGGISIIGTTGIVRPFSADAWVSSIRKEMSVALAMSPHVVINSGAKSERHLRQWFPDLPEQAFVHYGNFIGETLSIANDLGVPRLTMGLMLGKAVKLAEGNMDTHSHKVVMNRQFVASMMRDAGCDDATIARAEGLNMARELWNIIPSDRTEAFCRTVIGHCLRHCAPLVPKATLSILLISEEGTIYHQ